MDLFPTFLELANISMPDDRVLDGTSLVSSFLRNKTFDRFSFAFSGTVQYANL